MQYERFSYVESVNEATSVPAKFRIYEGFGHEITAAITDDIPRFFADTADLEATRADPAEAPFRWILDALGDSR
jgi:hypothetical protein